MSINNRRKKGDIPRREFEYAEDYAAEEFAQVAWRDRLIWLDEFVARHELGTWLNDIRGTIGFLRGDPHFSQLSGWAALTDGSILEAIQTGWHLYANDGRAPCYASAAGVEAARGWEEFFRQLRENPGISEDRLIEIRLTAEQRGATYGYTLAHQRFHSSGFFLRCKITVFAYAADMYRSIALIARSYGLQHVDFTGVTDPRTSWPALSLAGKLTTPAALAFSIGAAFLSLSGLTTSVTS